MSPISLFGFPTVVEWVWFPVFTVCKIQNKKLNQFTFSVQQWNVDLYNQT
jgi:hypothetical protein